MRWGIFFKISVIVIPIVVITAIFWGIISLDLSPDRWKHKEITYSHISLKYPSYERRGTSKSCFLNTTDGEKFVIPSGTKELKLLVGKYFVY